MSHLEPPSPLFASVEDTRAFADSLATRVLGKYLECHPRTTSTNDLALQAARSSGAAGQVFVADEQQRGRGRRGRTWECPPALGLLFSVLTRPQIELHDFGWLPLAAGLACVEALEASAADGAQPLRMALKWPNDLVVPTPHPPGWRKLGGILCESALPAQPLSPVGRGAGVMGMPFAVIGIGLNINQNSSQLPAKALAPPSSLYLECSAPFDRKSVLKRVLENLEARLLQLDSPAERPALKAAIAARLSAWWQPPAVLQLHVGSVEPGGGQELRGAYDGLDNFGRLLIRTPAGERIALADAEIVGVAG